MIGGNTFFLDGVDIHLWVIASDPLQNAEKIVLLNFTGWQHIHDQTCIVQAGEHPYLVKRSVIMYTAPRIMTLPQLETRKQQRLLTFRDDLSLPLLEKIRIGALKSPHIATEVQDIFYDQFPDLVEKTFP